jgi:hypothetical protein
MALGRDDTTRIVRFCLAGSGWGTALHEDDLCVVKIARSVAGGSETERFEGGTFEEALRRAADAGTLKTLCLEKQIAFLARSLPDGDSFDVDPARELEPTVAGMESQSRLYPAITAAISALMHETQRERGASSLYTSSGGNLFALELRRQWQTTDERRAELLAFRRRSGAALPRSLLLRLDRAEELLGGLVAARGRIESLEVTPAEVIARYSEVNAQFLTVIDELSGRAVAARMRATALAWMALLHAKEKTGIERAHLASVFAWDRYSAGQYAVVSALIAARHSYLHLFSAAAPRSADELLRQVLTSPVEQAVSEMERVALLRQDGGFGIDPAAWFTLISRKIDSFGAVETAVRASLA